MSISLHQQTASIISLLSAELKKRNLWQEDKPDEQALLSPQPFCCDTLSFQQWLQFIFIPKMSEMLKNSLPLPTNIALCPMAEATLGPLGEEVADLINLIADLDEILSGNRQQTLFIRS